MSSPGHRQNILDSSYDRAGVGIAIADDGKVFFTAEFLLAGLGRNDLSAIPTRTTSRMRHNMASCANNKTRHNSQKLCLPLPIRGNQSGQSAPNGSDGSTRFSSSKLVR